MNRQYHKWLACLALLGLIPGTSTGAQAPYVLSQTVNQIPVEASTCIRLIRELNQQEAGDSQASQDLASQITQQESQLSQLHTSIQDLEQSLATADATLQDLQGQLDELLEVTFARLIQEQPDFAQASEANQAAQVAAQPDVQALTQDVQAQKDSQAQLQARLDQAKQEAASLDYDRHALEDALEQSKGNRQQLNQCLLYPYSAHHLAPGRLPLNPASESLADYLIGVNQALSQLVPLAYQKVKYQEILTFFQPDTSNAEEVAQALEGKRELVLSPEGEAAYQYAQELTLFDIEILANLALRQYYQDQDTATLQAKFQQVYQMKIGQYHYLQALNPDAFEALKQGLADYLNTHHYQAEARAKLAPLVARYQLHLVAFDASSGQWQAVPADQEPFLSIPDLATTDLTEPDRGPAHPVEPAHEEEEDGNQLDADTTPGPHQPARPAHPERRPAEQADSAASDASQSSNTASSQETPADQAVALKRLKDRLNKRTGRSRQRAGHSSRDAHSRGGGGPRPSASTSTSSQASDEAKAGSHSDKQGAVKLPDTGEQVRYMALAAGLAGVGALVLGVYLYRRYRQHQALKKIHFD